MKAEILEKAMNTSEDLKVEVLSCKKTVPDTMGPTEKAEEKYTALLEILHRMVDRENQVKNQKDKADYDRRLMAKLSNGNANGPAAPAPKGKGKNNKGKRRKQGREGWKRVRQRKGPQQVSKRR